MLTDNQLARAVRANPRWKGQLGADWPTDQQLAAAGIAPLQGEGDFAFAEAVAAYQAGHALECDGILGKLAGAALRGVAAPIPKGQPILIVDGKPCPAPDCRVVTWKDPDGLGFVNLKVWRPRLPGPQSSAWHLARGSTAPCRRDACCHWGFRQQRRPGHFA
jgi:hypothetical protein